MTITIVKTKFCTILSLMIKFHYPTTFLQFKSCIIPTMKIKFNNSNKNIHHLHKKTSIKESFFFGLQLQFSSTAFNRFALSAAKKSFINIKTTRVQRMRTTFSLKSLCLRMRRSFSLINLSFFFFIKKNVSLIVFQLYFCR